MKRLFLVFTLFVACIFSGHAQDAKAVLDKFYAGETNTTIYQNSSFVENKLEYMPIPFNEMQNAKGLYKQNPGY